MHQCELTRERVEPLFRGRLGRPYVHVESCASTQLLVSTESVVGALGTADHQTAGRGRLGRSWEDLPGSSLLASLVLRSPAHRGAQLSLVCALAVAEAVEAETLRPVYVKWPNDVLIDGRKIAGLLLEARRERVVCGIGVNVGHAEDDLPTGTRVPPGSLRIATGRRHDRASLLVELLVILEQRYDAWLESGLAPLLPELERRDALRGKVVTLGSLKGEAAGIAPDGRLRILTADGETLVASGEVALQVSG